MDDTVKGQLDLERQGGGAWGGVVTPVLQCLVALAAATWHNDWYRRHGARSLLAYDHRTD